MKQAAAAPASGAEALLWTDSLSVRFGGLMALASVNFTARLGQVTSLIGPNGAGKTTAINTITGIYRASSGRVFFADREITGHRTHRIRRLGLTRTFQNLQVFQNMTVLENVMVGLHADTKSEFTRSMFRLPGVGREERRIRERAMEALEFSGLADKAHWTASSLSYGDMKRTEMARALVGDPRMVLLDEPVAGLNAAETDEVSDLIVKTRDRGVSVLLVEHDMNLVMDISDRVVVLNYGEKIAEGTPTEVQQDPRVIAAYLGEEH